MTITKVINQILDWSKTNINVDWDNSENTPNEEFQHYINIIEQGCNKQNLLELPKENMTNGKFRTDHKTLQFCVIPNTEENRDSIRHINKLAKEQNSFFRLKMRYRCPKEGKHYGWGGDVACEDANGIGIYIQGATANCDMQLAKKDGEMFNSFVENRKMKNDLIKKVEEKDTEMDKVLLENLKLREEIATLKNEIASKNAIEHLESACGDYMGENGEDDTYEKMCGMVDSLWNYDKETQV